MNHLVMIAFGQFIVTCRLEFFFTNKGHRPYILPLERTMSLHGNKDAARLQGISFLTVIECEPYEITVCLFNLFKSSLKTKRALLEELHNLI